MSARNRSGCAGTSAARRCRRSGCRSHRAAVSDFLARLAALVPKPRVNLTRFHGVFAPNSKHRALVTKAERGKVNKARESDEPPMPAERRAAVTWAKRLKRVFNIDIETCSECGGAVKVIA